MTSATLGLTLATRSPPRSGHGERGRREGWRQQGTTAVASRRAAPTREDGASEGGQCRRGTRHVEGIDVAAAADVEGRGRAGMAAGVAWRAAPAREDGAGEGQGGDGDGGD